MNEGLDLELFLQLLRADLGAWFTLGLIVGLLSLMTWTSWGSRKALRKCLVLSIAAHVVLVFYGTTWPGLVLALDPDASRTPSLRSIEVVPEVEVERSAEPPSDSGSPDGSGQPGRSLAVWDRPDDSSLLALAEPTLAPDRPAPEVPDLDPPAPRPAEPPATDSVTPEINPPEPSAPEPRPGPESDEPPPLLPEVSPEEVAAAIPPAPEIPEPDPTLALPETRLRPEIPRPEPPSLNLARSEPPALAPLPMPDPPDDPRPEEPEVAATDPEASGPEEPEVAAAIPAEHPDEPVPVDLGEIPESEAAGPRAWTAVAPAPGPVMAEVDVRSRSRPTREPAGRAAIVPPRRFTEGPGPIAMNLVTPRSLPRLPELQGPVASRPLADIPEVFRSRLDPNRFARAQSAGASRESEQAVERALDWLARHQDADGRWDGGTMKYADGTIVPGEDNFTIHCPPGDPCAGENYECFYWEADTALTGLALLAYLGAGYSHLDGKYAATVDKGLEFLRLIQKPDGDLRGPSKNVGMYCHAMAALALCEAYALTGDQRLRDPSERAVDFVVKAQAPGGRGWRYTPRPTMGDTSILGWMVLVLKSAKIVGIPVPPATYTGTLQWLEAVSSGPAKGLARYQPYRPVDPTMTAEAWVCRQFLGVGGPGSASDEAASYLLSHGPARDEYNLYYWYYGTLALYQRGGEDWVRWNDLVRDQLVRRQRLSGHKSGSWDPDPTQYGSRGGRLYSTAVAALTLEVYYRYLRLYDEPGPAPMLAPAPDRSDDPTLRRAGVAPRAHPQPGTPGRPAGAR